MKLYGWVVVFGAMLFGVGWLVHGRTYEPVEPSRTGGPRDLRQVGPHIANVKRFATEIGLTEQQVQEIESLVEETTEQVRQREREVTAYLRATKDRFDAILTEGQLERLEELIHERWCDWRMAKIDTSIEWLEENATTSESARAQVKSILTEYYDRQSELMRGRGRRSPEVKKQSRELVSRRDESLAEVLSADDLKRFVDERLSRRRGGWDRSRGDRRRDGRRRGRHGPPFEREPDKQESASESTEIKKPEQKTQSERNNR